MTDSAPGLETLAGQEEELVFDRFDEETAWLLGLAAAGSGAWSRACR